VVAHSSRDATVPALSTGSTDAKGGLPQAVLVGEPKSEEPGHVSSVSTSLEDFHVTDVPLRRCPGPEDPVPWPRPKDPVLWPHPGPRPPWWPVPDDPLPWPPRPRLSAGPEEPVKQGSDDTATPFPSWLKDATDPQELEVVDAGGEMPSWVEGMIKEPVKQGSHDTATPFPSWLKDATDPQELEVVDAGGEMPSWVEGMIKEPVKQGSHDTVTPFPSWLKDVTNPQELEVVNAGGEMPSWVEGMVDSRKVDADLDRMRQKQEQAQLWAVDARRAENMVGGVAHAVL
jgi:hypothetical protein